MAAKSAGQVLERVWKRGRGYALRFSAYGERQYVTLGFERDGWTRETAEEALRDILAEVRLGIWIPPRKRKGAGSECGGPDSAPLFGPFARQLTASRKGQVSDAHHRYELWTLSHLLPYFGDWPVTDIDVQAVDAYRHHKVQEAEARRRAIERRKPLRDEGNRPLRPLSATSINKTIDTLQWVLSVALEYRLVSENPATGKRRRLPQPQIAPVYLDTAEQIEALLEAAAALDRDPKFRLSDRRAVVATLVLSGPRAQELCNLLWRDVDLANGRLFIGRSKTQAGLREIRMLPVLRDILAAHKAAAYRSEADDLVFPTGTGGHRNKDNLRGRVLEAVLRLADERLAARGRVALPRGVTPHKLRHTFASVLTACGEDAISVMRQLGHTDPAFTLRTYAHMMSREPGERGRLKALVNGERVVAPPTEAPSRILDCAAYELPILRALSDRGGVARRRDVRAALLDELTLSDRDRETLPCGREARWEARLDKARENLKRDGYLKVDSPRGVWELSDRGAARLQRTAATRTSTGAARRPRASRGMGAMLA